MYLFEVYSFQETIHDRFTHIDTVFRDQLFLAFWVYPWNRCNFIIVLLFSLLFNLFGILFFLPRYFSMNFGMHTLCKASFFPHLHNDGEYFIVMLLIVENQFLKIFDSFISNSWNDGFLSIQRCSKKYCFHIQEIFSSVISGLH